MGGEALCSHTSQQPPPHSPSGEGSEVIGICGHCSELSRALGGNEVGARGKSSAAHATVPDADKGNHLEGGRMLGCVNEGTRIKS